MPEGLRDITAAELFALAELHRRFRTEWPERTVTLQDLQEPCGVRLVGADLSQIDLHDLHFDDSWFESCTFRGAVLYGSFFIDTVMLNCDFSGADMIKMEIHDTDFRGSRFDGARLVRTTILNSDLRNTSFAGANLSGALIVRCNIEGANFEGATLTYAGIRDNVGTATGLPPKA